MIRNMRRVAVLFLSVVCLAVPAGAGKVSLQILVTNPLAKDQAAQIKSNLPAGITTNDILSLGGLELGYDIRNDLYYVHKNVNLGPKGSGAEHAEFRIELRDIWFIPEEDINALESQAANLAKLLADTEHEDIAKGMVALIRDTIKVVQERQEKHQVGEVTVMNHISAYEESVDDLDRVKHDVGKLENLVLSTGQDPGKLIGKVKDAPAPVHDFDVKEEEYGTALIVIKVHNTSPTETRVMKKGGATPPLQRYLPKEVRSADILDSAGLEVRVDLKTGRCILYKDNLEIPPEETITYTVKIRDKWNVNKPRIESLKERAETTLIQIQAASTKVESVENTVVELIEKLKKIAAEPGPTTLDDKYVAFFRDQSRRLDIIEEQLNRIRAALKPMQRTTKLGFKAKPPSMKSTWLIIYIILGFLASISLLFFLRWYGKSKEEKIHESEQ